MALQRFGVHRRHHRHHHYTACSLLGLVTCAGPTNSREVFRGVTLGFISHMADISQFSVEVCVSVCLCPFTKLAVHIYCCDFEFFYTGLIVSTEIYCSTYPT
jgi:fructose/tagatose bisphosphate aldolase